MKHIFSLIKKHVWLIGLAVIAVTFFILFESHAHFIIRKSTVLKYTNGWGRTENVIIPNGITKIGDNAFQDDIKLTNISLPEGLTEIGDCAFMGCTNLAEITIPETVTKIGDAAFKSCDSLTKIQLPNGLIEIGGNAFSFCHMTEITIPETVAKICNGAFSYSDIEKIYIPDSVEYLGDDVFEGCDNLTKVRLPENENVKMLGSHTFYRCENLKTLEIPSNIWGLGLDAIYHCPNLKTIIIHNAELLNFLIIYDMDFDEQMKIVVKDENWQQVNLTFDITERFQSRIEIDVPDNDVMDPMPSVNEGPIQVYYSGEEPSGLQFIAELDDPEFFSLGHMQVALTTSAPVQDLRIVGLQLEEDDNEDLQLTVSHTAYDIGKLLPGQAVLVGVPVGEVFPVWGFVYTDEEGMSHAFSAYEEGDGIGYADFLEIYGRAPGIGIAENVQIDAPGPAPEGPTSSGHALPYLVWTTEEVPIYTGPGTDYAYSKSMAPGVYTIVEESTGQGATLWGKLKSGAGWIALDHIRLQDGSDVLNTP